MAIGLGIHAKVKKLRNDWYQPSRVIYMSYWKMTSPSQTLLIEFPHKRIRVLLTTGR
jgi:hypothetical protein